MVTMKIYLKILSIFYAIGAFLHLLDVFGLRLDFFNLSTGWKAWILFLMIGDSVAAFGLWKQKKFGDRLFLWIAGSQLVAYGYFPEFFGKQNFLIGFHLVTVGLYFVLRVVQQRDSRRASSLRAQN